MINATTESSLTANGTGARAQMSNRALARKVAAQMSKLVVNWLKVRMQMLDRGPLVRTFAPIFLK